MNTPIHRKLVTLAATLLVTAGMCAVRSSVADARNVRNTTRTSVNANVNQNRNVNVNQNRNVNVNRNVDIDVYVDRGWDRGHPVATAAAVTAAVVVTAAIVGSVVYSLPPACSMVVINGITYQQCGGAWYQPQYVGTQVTYVVVNPPR